MLSDIDLTRQLQSLGIDDGMRKTLKEIAPFIKPFLDDAIKAGYESILRYPDAAKAYSGMKIEDAVNIQRNHWLPKS